MKIVLISFGIMLIMFCAVGIIVCLGVFADKLDELIRGGDDD
jgi:hypothetical protein